MEKYLQSYLKERNIPINSLEANSIQEGYQLAVKNACNWLQKYFVHDIYGMSPSEFSVFINKFHKEMEEDLDDYGNKSSYK